MKLNETKLRQLITEELIAGLLKERKIAQAEALLWESRQKRRLDEKWWKKVLGTGGWTPTDADIKDEELEDNLEDVTVNVIKALRQSGRYTRKQAEAIVKKYLSGDPDLTRVDHKDLTDLFFKLNKSQTAEIEKLETAEDKAEPGGAPGADGAKGDQGGGASPVASAEEPAAEPEKAATVADTVKDLASILRDTTGRTLLMRGLYRLLTNKQTAALLNAMPEGQATAVKDFLRQMMEMDPKTLAAVRTKVGEEFDVEDQTKGQNVPAEWRKQGMDAQRKGLVRGAEKEAGLGLKESKNSRATTERAIILEVLNMYVEKKISLQKAA